MDCAIWDPIEPFKSWSGQAFGEEAQKECIVIDHFLAMHVEFFDVGDWIAFSSEFIKFRYFKMLGEWNHGNGSIKRIGTQGLKLECLWIIPPLDGFQGCLHFFPFCVEG